MKFAAVLCLLLALGAAVASAESPTPFKTVNLFKPYDHGRARSLQTVAEATTPLVTRGIRLTEFTLKRERDRVHQAQLSIGTPQAPSTTPVGDVRGQALVTVQVNFRTLPLP